uniref:Uncharacterized protein n=1 Tax=Siphoviridae sp. ct4Uy2 TaxID=2827777 RepID=A0A8S5SJY8_9CAUD|nr:MAG TPA: hypothetical protein [Siphoviridae sp. ct4Uy2]
MLVLLVSFSIVKIVIINELTKTKQSKNFYLNFV